MEFFAQRKRLVLYSRYLYYVTGAHIFQTDINNFCNSLANLDNTLSSA